MKKIVILCLLFLLSSLLIFSQAEMEKIFALKIKESIEVDGLLNEPIWKKAPEASDLMQYKPGGGRPDSLNTSVKVLYDDNFLYVGFLCYDPQPEKIEARETERDADLRDDDSVYVLIDTPYDRDNLYYFGTNLLGSKFDGRVNIPERTADHTWNGLWKSAGQKTAFGWSAEIAVDLRNLKYEKEKEKILGLCLSRIVPRMLESSFWAGPLDPAFKISQLGQLKRIDLAKAEMKLKIFPHVISTSEGENKLDLGGGVDVRYDFTQMISGHLTLYPDFATVETDQERINLTRFEYYVPEKRNFFLEGSGVYNQKIRLFYSKRIPDIYGGIKLIGRSKGFEFSGMSAQAKRDEYTDESQSNFSVFRFRKNVMKSSSIGFLAANRHIGGKNIGTAGFDTFFQLSNSLSFTGQFAASYGEYREGNIAFFLRPSYDSETFYIHLGYTHLGENFGDDVNKVGFIKDDNRREVDTGIGITFVKNKGGVERFKYDSNYNVYWGMDGNLRSWQVDQGFICDFINKFSLIAHHVQEFKAQDDIFFPEGDFRNHLTTLGLGFNTKEWELATLSFTLGRNFGQKFSMLEIGKNIHVTQDLDVEFEMARVYFGWGRASRNQFVHMLKARYYFTKDLSLKFIYQTNTNIMKVNFEMLVTYRFLPPSGLLQIACYIGTPRFGIKEMRENTLFLKIGYMF